MNKQPHATKKGPGRRHKEGHKGELGKGKPAQYPTRKVKK